MRSKIKSNRQTLLKTIIVTIFFISILVLYVHNLTRDIYSGDIGDFVTAAHVWGVAHPSGYPLFVLLGGLLSHIPLPLPPVSKVGLVSVFASFAGLIFFYKLAYRATKDIFISLLSTSILAFSYLFWFFTEIPEAFALNNFFAIAIFYFAILFYKTKNSNYLYLFVFFSFLSFTHHQTIILVFPGVILLVFTHWKIIFQSRKRFIFLILFALLGFSPYLYVPIAASQHPVVNWGDVSNLDSFIHLFLRKDYGALPQPFKIQAPLLMLLLVLKDYFTSIISSISFPAFVNCLIGMVNMFRTDKRFLFSLFLSYFIAGPLFVFYGTPIITNADDYAVIERFYTLSSIILLVFLPYGFLTIKKLFRILFVLLFSKTIYASIVIVAFSIIPIMLITYNLSRTDLSKTHIGDNFAIDILSPLPQNSALFLRADTPVLNTWYVHYVLGVRPDIQLINPPRVGNNYYQTKELKEYLRLHPEIMNGPEATQGVLLQIKQKRSIFSTYKMEYTPKNYIWVPRGLTFELADKKEIPQKNIYLAETEKIVELLHIPRREKLAPSEKNLLTPEISYYYSLSFVEIGEFIKLQYNDPKSAIPFYEKAIWADNENPIAYGNLGISQYKALNDCNESEKNVKKAIFYYSVGKAYYAYLYTIYEGCQKEKKAITDLKDKYHSLFKEDINKEIDRLKKERSI